MGNLRPLPALSRIMNDERGLWLDPSEGKILRVRSDDLHEIPVVIADVSAVGTWGPVRNAVELIVTDMTSPSDVEAVAPWSTEEAADIMDEYLLVVRSGFQGRYSEIDERLREQLQRAAIDLSLLGMVRASLHGEVVESCGKERHSSRTWAAEELRIAPQAITNSRARTNKQWRSYAFKHLIEPDGPSP